MTFTTELAQTLIGKAKIASFVLEYLSNFESEDIDADSVDLRFEVDGVDTGTTVSIVAECGKAAAIIDALLDELESEGKKNAQDVQIKARLCRESNSLHDRLREAEKHIAELKQQLIKPLPIGELVQRLENQTGEPWGERYLTFSGAQQDPVAWRYRYHNGLAPSIWKYADCESECNSAPNYQRQPLYTTPQPAPVVLDGWISCSERMPEPYVPVNFYTPSDIENDVTESTYNGHWDGDFWHQDATLTGYDSSPILRKAVVVTHWMPLPAAPKVSA